MKKDIHYLTVQYFTRIQTPSDCPPPCFYTAVWPVSNNVSQSGTESCLLTLHNGIMNILYTLYVSLSLYITCGLQITFRVQIPTNLFEKVIII